MANEQAEKVVTITMQNGRPVASPDPVQIKKDEQKVKWCSEFDFKIEIDGVGVKYSSGGNGCAFQAKSDKFSQEKKYKYSITANGVTNDPEVDVKP